MSIEEIEARISKLTADIELQTEVLRQLHQLKSAALRELNNIRDPFSRLPLELASQIFQYLLPKGPPKPDPRRAPMLLLNVCHRWTDMALSLPDLWAAIYFDLPRAQIMDCWLHRAGRYPLSIHLHTDLSPELVFVMRQFANQIQYLSLYQEQFDARSIGSLGLLPNLEAMKVGALKIQDSEGYMNVSYSSSFVILKLLRLAPNLQECIFDQDAKIGELVGDSEDEEEDGGLVPNLHTLKLGSPQSNSYSYGCQCDLRMLPYLTLPSLQTLHLTFSATSPADLSSFLRRSSPPLHTLILAYDSQSAEFTDCLRLVPSLECLKLFVKLKFHHPFLLDIPPSALSDSTLQLVPNLGTLEINSECEYIAERCYAAFLRVLLSRRSKLLRASLTLHKRDDPEPDPAVYAGLQELAAEGMDIDLRSRNRQWFPLQ
ncbi:F-box domain-containing protein [Favolaschia claudopus]|uniref:F-box domain-containing protein n=1 Tax=Favolaschia claudopus TaxID=2862362 RepID=A0AAW0CJM6_9AGAR